jgi:hypothetical protein
MVGLKRLMFLVHAPLFFLLTMLPMLLPVPVQAVIPAVGVIPSSLNVELEQNFNVDIAISDVLDLYGWEFTLSWNPYLLDVVNVTEGPFLKGDGRSTFFSYNISLADGRMVVDCTLLGWISGVSGSGILSTLTFHSKNYGECPLNMYNLLLIDSNEQPILCQTSNGYVRVISPHDVAVTLVDVSPLLAPIGDPVNIDVSIQNQGSYAEVAQVTAYVNSTIVGIQQTSLNGGSLANVSFTWNTTACAKGDYLILATISPVPGEVDLTDNTKTADSMVTVLTLGHDVGVVVIEPVKTVVGQGYDLGVTVKVGNCGVFSETFSVTAYMNTTVLGFQTVTLSSGTKADILFVKSSLSFSKGNYTLNASVSLVSGETEIDDNTLADGWVIITTPGDIQGDFVVDIYDAISLAKVFGSVPTSLRWDSNADINNDSNVDIYDAIILANHFSQH